MCPCITYLTLHLNQSLMSSSVRMSCEELSRVHLFLILYGGSVTMTSTFPLVSYLGHLHVHLGDTKVSHHISFKRTFFVQDCGHGLLRRIRE